MKGFKRGFLLTLINRYLIFGSVRLKGGIEIKRGSKIESKSLLLGRGTRLNKHCVIKGDGNVSLGNYCAVGWNVLFQASNHDYHSINLNFKLAKELGKRQSVSQKSGIEVGHNVWIGDRSIILPGVKIGNGVVVGAASVVTKNLPDYSICVGSPARVIKYRFSPEKIKLINESQWWALKPSEMKLELDKLDDV